MVDLLVVTDESASRGKRSAPIIRMLAEEYPLAVDIVVRPKGVFEKWKDVPGSFAAQVLKEGIVLYERRES